MEKIAIVILHYGRKNLTLQCLESVAKLRRKNFETETIVVNNNHAENLGDLKKQFSNILLLNSPSNLGFAAGNNSGIKKALTNNADAVLLVNNDTVLDRDLLLQLFKVAHSNGQFGIISPKIYFVAGYEYHRSRYKQNELGKVFWYAGGIIDWKNLLMSHRGVDEVDNGQYDQQSETDFATGCAMLIKKEVFQKIGFFDEKYFLYLEDVDFCQRAKKVGFEILFAPDGKIWHYNAGSSGVGGPLHDYFITRNRMLFAQRFAPARTKIAVFRESLKLLATGRHWQKIGVKDFYVGRFNQGSWKD